MRPRFETEAQGTRKWCKKFGTTRASNPFGFVVIVSMALTSDEEVSFLETSVL